jgi:dienelactone hydrolase
MASGVTTGRVEPGLPGLVAPPRPRLSARVRAALNRAWAIGRELGGTVVAALDALLLGLIVAYLVAVVANGPGAYLGLPWPVEMLVAGGGAMLIALAGALAGLAVRRGLRAFDRGLERALARRAPRRLAAAVRLPFRLLAGLPAGRIGAFAVLVWLAMVGVQTGFLQLFMPAGMTSPYIWIAGAVTALAGGAGHLVRPSVARPLGRVRRGGVALLAGVAITVAGGGATIMLSPGTSDGLVVPDPRFDGAAVATTLADPGLPGPYAVQHLSYGSGTDIRRAAFGSEAALTTPTVDAAAILHPLGWGADEVRQWFWGFGTDALPLNGLVWAPEGEGPFPLVLIVHGNHAMGEFSEFGYAYLGEHLASRGFITVSVDEDFLNGSWANDWQGSEQLARAWFLLLHVDQWRTWNETPGNPFFGRVDLDRVALMGHSRGGEAASVAAALAAQEEAPRSDLAPWPTDLSIRAVVAIAPSDGQYTSPPVLKGVDLLELSGGHDADARGWMGLRQYARAVVADDGVKAAFFAYRANHGQFNSVWGRSDFGRLGGALLNLAPLLDPADQQDVAKTAIGAFLEASLHGQRDYLGLFQRPMVGREWLPDDIFLVRSRDGAFEALTAGDPAQPIEGVTASFDGFAVHRSRAIPMRALFPDQTARGLELRWDAGDGVAAWGLEGLSAVTAPGGPGELHLSIANGSPAASDSGILDPLVELTTTDGITVSLPLSRWGALPPPLVTALVKNDFLDSIAGSSVAVQSPYEIVLQTYALPLSDFVARDPRFRPDHLDGLRLLFDRGAGGGAWIAEVGLSPAR